MLSKDDPAGGTRRERRAGSADRRVGLGDRRERDGIMPEADRPGDEDRRAAAIREAMHDERAVIVENSGATSGRKSPRSRRR